MAQDLAAGEGWSSRSWGSNAAHTPWSVDLWTVCDENLCYQHWLWTSCMTGFDLGYLIQFSCTEQSTSCLIFPFGKLFSTCIILMNTSLFSNSSLNLFVAGFHCLIFPFLIQREPPFPPIPKPISFYLFVLWGRLFYWTFLALFHFHLTFPELSNLKSRCSS